MHCILINEYGQASEVLKYVEVATPTIGDDEVLVKQYASSVNPIDFKMRSGYGRVIFSKKRGFDLPLVLGRDVSGEVVLVGKSVTSFSIGDRVYGVPAAKAQGAYAEFVVSKESDITLKPALLSYAEAASIPYVACTVWDALVTKAGLTEQNSKGKKVFVQGGSGGIGALAIQVLKAWGAHVATTCSGKHVEAVLALGADVVIDYETQDYAAMLSNYDVVLETIGGKFESKSLGILRHDKQSVFVTLVHPLLKNFDDYGLFKGALVNLFDFSRKWIGAKSAGIGTYGWATFKPSKDALLAIKLLVETGKFRAHIDREFSLPEIAEAHKYCEEGRSNGKVILKIA